MEFWTSRKNAQISWSSHQLSINIWKISSQFSTLFCLENERYVNFKETLHHSLWRNILIFCFKPCILVINSNVYSQNISIITEWFMEFYYWEISFFRSPVHDPLKSSVAYYPLHTGRKSNFPNIKFNLNIWELTISLIKKFTFIIFTLNPGSI